MINEVSQMTNTIIQETNPIVKIRNIVDSYRHVFLTKIANDKELMEFLEVYPKKLSNNDFYTLRTKVYLVLMIFQYTLAQLMVLFKLLTRLMLKSSQLDMINGLTDWVVQINVFN